MRKEDGEGQEGRSRERLWLCNSVAHISYHTCTCCSDTPSGRSQEERVKGQIFHGHFYHLYGVYAYSLELAIHIMPQGINPNHFQQFRSRLFQKG